MKRIVDLLLILAAAPLWLPVMVTLALVVRLKMGSPIFFRQQRPGRDGRIFTLLKFRTMNEKRDREGNLLPDGERLTCFGQWLRSTSLDELPELLNIIKGDMSLVGPRPLLVQYLARYSPAEARRHEMRPGLTGWVQVNGRNALTWEEKFELDLWYVDHQSLWLDLKILFLTLKKVLRKEGISAVGEATMPEFQGTQRPKLPLAAEERVREAQTNPGQEDQRDPNHVHPI